MLSLDKASTFPFLVTILLNNANQWQAVTIGLIVELDSYSPKVIEDLHQKNGEVEIQEVF